MQTTNIKAVPRRQILRTGMTLAGFMALGQLPALAQSPPKDQITVWKTPSCGCCKEWVTHLRKNGFEVVTHDVADTAPERKRLGLANKFASCHTGSVGGYALEGHVPAAEVRRLLREKPQAVGLAVPGMPVGSPGMEVDGSRDAFQVLLVVNGEQSRVYQSYAAIAPSKS